MTRMAPPPPPDWSPDEFAHQQRVHIVYWPLESVPGLYVRLRNGKPGVIMVPQLDPARYGENWAREARRRVVLAHELGHLFGPPSVTLALASRATLALVDSSAWAADKGLLANWAQDEDELDLTARCSESVILDGAGVWEDADLYDAAKAERVADRFAAEHLMPPEWVDRYVDWLMATGRVLDHDAREEMADYLHIESRVCQRWLAYYEATERLKYASNSGYWDRGDKLADLQNGIDHAAHVPEDLDWHPEPEFLEIEPPFVEPDI